MGDRRCCCSRGCIIVSDNFNRGDNTDLNFGITDKWTERTGDSSISSQRLSVPSGGEVVTIAKHPTNHWTARAYATLPSISDGDKYRVCCDWDTTNDYYLAAELDCGAAGAATLRVIEHNGGIDTVLNEVTAGYIGDGSDSLLICRSLEGGFATCSVSTVAWECVGKKTKGDWRAGVANASAANTVVFDDFYFEEHWFTNHDCQQCECECEGHCLPETLTLTISASGSCSCWNVTVDLTFDPTELPSFVWKGEVLGAPDWQCENSTDWKWELWCDPGEDCTNPQWRLCYSGPMDYDGTTCTAGHTPCGNLNTGHCSISQQCDPFILVFPLLTCAGSGPPEPPPTCLQQWTITE